MMHSSRKHILWRWLAVLVCVLGTGFWLVWFKAEPVRPSLPNNKNLQPPELAIPDKEVHNQLRKGMRLVAHPPQQDISGRVNLSFVPEANRNGTVGQEQPVMLGLIFQGAKKHYAVLNGRIYAQGQTMEDGKRVVSVSKQGVLLGGQGGEQWIPWKSPTMVQLQESEEDETGPVNDTHGTQVQVPENNGTIPEEARELLKR